jgi:predicted TIM-barrel fold metal-dependent hydrolase
MGKQTRREFLKTAAIGAAVVSASAGLTEKGQAQTKKPLMIVDTHSHMEIPEAVALLPEKPKPLSSPVSAETAAYQERLVAALRQQLQNPEKRIEDMDKVGIDLSIISIAPAQFFYNLEGQLAIDVSRKQNDQFAERVQKHPKKFGLMSQLSG